MLGRDIFTTFQNGVGPQGQPSPDGNTDSTIVEFTASGHVVRQWDLHGKCDGITADTGKHLLIATVNEDAHSSVYTITPGAPSGHQVLHYRYNDRRCRTTAAPMPSRSGTTRSSSARRRPARSARPPRSRPTRPCTR